MRSRKHLTLVHRPRVVAGEVVGDEVVDLKGVDAVEVVELVAAVNRVGTYL